MLDSDYLPLWCALNRLIANYWIVPLVVV
jgi:hypothetical protein